jgi:hypothetical protein
VKLQIFHKSHADGFHYFRKIISRPEFIFLYIITDYKGLCRLEHSPSLPEILALA